MSALGFVLQQEAELETLTLEVLKSTEIEGEFLNPEQVRSSIARRLGMDISGLVPSDRHVDGVVEMILDATQGKLNTSKWAKIAKCSADTALRDIQDLVDKGILRKEAAGGRSTSYELVAERV